MRSNFENNYSVLAHPKWEAVKGGRIVESRAIRDICFGFAPHCNIDKAA
jgi:hypothetical protein